MIFTRKELQWIKDKMKPQSFLSPFHQIQEQCTGNEEENLRKKGFLSNHNWNKEAEKILGVLLEPTQAGRIVYGIQN